MGQRLGKESELEQAVGPGQERTNDLATDHERY
jgi:hypothetical protein